MELFEEIVRTINEELGINDLVSDTVNHLFSLIIKGQKKIPYNDIKNGIVNCHLFGKKIEVNYILYFIENEEDIQNIQTNGSLSQDCKKLSCSLCYIRSINKYIDCKGTTQHEVEHLYQALKSKNFPTLKPKTNKFYTTAINLAKYSSSWYEQIVGYVIYYNNKFETNAFTNEIYRFLIDNPSKNPLELIKTTPVYQNISIINKTLNNLNEYHIQNIENVVYKHFGKHFNWWLNMAKNIVKNYSNAFGKSIVKAEKDINENYFLDRNIDNLILTDIENIHFSED